MSNSNFGFLALALRQRLIKRWSLMHSVQPESVLEHSAVVKACDTYSAYIKCKLEVAAGNGLEFQDALSKMERVVAQVKSDFPEIDALDKWFGNGLGHSVDKLLAGGNDD